MEYQTLELNNGIRLIFSSVQSPVGHCGLFINTGSRDELPHQHGMAHFIEHTIFKGTRKRKVYHILSRLDDVGGELNAYTTKEETVVHASFLNSYFERSLELIADIVFASVFPQRELDKEKEVIVDEINSYKDSPSEQIFDDFEEKLFANSPLGRPILGTEDTIRTFSTENVLEFIAQNYHTDQMVLSVVGNIAWGQLVKLVQKHYGNVPARLRGASLRQRPEAVQFAHEAEYGTHQAHCVLGRVAYDAQNGKKTAFALLNNLLGGGGMNARLSFNLREKYGIAYNVESDYEVYSDTGVFTIYFGTDKANLPRSLRVVERELTALCAKPLGSTQLQRAKRQLIGQLAMGTDSNEGLMMTNGKSLLYYNKVDSLELVYQRIEAISAANLLEVANEMLLPAQLSRLIFT